MFTHFDFITITWLLDHTGLPFSLFFLIFIYLASSGLSCVSQDICCVMWDLLLWHMDSLVVEQAQ